jgi:hypothetical protein
VFQLIQPTTVKLMHINVRTEKHGPNDVDAFDLDFAIEGENRRVLGLLHDDLCGAFYFNAEADEGQEALEGVDHALPNLRFPKLSARLPWDSEATGVDLKVIYGLGDDVSNIELEGGKASAKAAEVKEGGTALVFFRYSASGYPDGVLDKLRKKLKQEVTITLVRPEKLREDAVIDGTVGHPGAAAGQGSLLDGDAMTPERALAGSLAPGESVNLTMPGGEDATLTRNGGDPDDDTPDDDSEGGQPDDGAAEQAELEAGMQASMDAAGVRPKRARKSAATH